MPLTITIIVILLLPLHVLSADTCFEKDNYAPEESLQRRVTTLDGLVIVGAQRQCDLPSSDDDDTSTSRLVVDVFRGIPYARAPIDSLRFQPPVPVGEWRQNGTHLAFADGPACPQARAEGVRWANEDCLYLNIFSPHESNSSDRRFPVVVFIHGGRYAYGSASDYPGHVLAALEQVVVVTFNYRLGPFGFLGFGENYGLLDQRMAVQWVRENIEEFQGDSENITLVGHEAGGASVGFLLRNSNGAFHRAVALSGSDFAPWASYRSRLAAEGNARQFAESIGCGRSKQHDILRCLMGKHESDLALAAYDFDWAPLITEWPTADSDAIPYLAGVSTCAGKANFFGSLRRAESDRSLEATTRRIIEQSAHPQQSSILRQRRLGEAARLVRFIYGTDDDDRRQSDAQQLLDLYTDSGFVAPLRTKIRAVDASVQRYEYLMNSSCDISASAMRDWHPPAVTHDQETFYLFGRPFLPNWEHPQRRLLQRNLIAPHCALARLFMRLIASFARQSDPTPASADDVWTPSPQGYLLVDASSSSAPIVTMRHDEHYRHRRARLWSDTVPQLLTADAQEEEREEAARRATCRRMAEAATTTSTTEATTAPIGIRFVVAKNAPAIAANVARRSSSDVSSATTTWPPPTSTTTRLPTLTAPKVEGNSSLPECIPPAESALSSTFSDDERFRLQIAVVASLFFACFFLLMMLVTCVSYNRYRKSIEAGFWG